MPRRPTRPQNKVLRFGGATDDLKPWERQPGETQKEWEAFCVYRDMGYKRTFNATAKKCGYKVRTDKKGNEIADSGAVRRWANQTDWIGRCRHFDQWLDREFIREQAHERREMYRRHSNVALMMLQKVISRIQEIEPSMMSVSDTAKWLEIAVKVERMSRGDPTDIIDQRHYLPEGQRFDATEVIEKLTPDEHRAAMLTVLEDVGYFKERPMLTEGRADGEVEVIEGEVVEYGT